MQLTKNKSQEDAINTIHGPVILISCPGSGKTTTLTRRIKKIIESGVNPEEVLMITFANAAAKDMSKRYKQMYDSDHGITFTTIHSLCFQILKAERNYENSDLILEREKFEIIIRQIKDNPMINDPWKLTRSFITELSTIKNNYVNITTYTPESCDKTLFMQLFNTYESQKKLMGKIDFDDILIECENLLALDKKVLKKWRQKFSYIQCDEYQDTNRTQKDILYALAGETKNICVVGDDDQSIYGFRGADPSIMKEFSKDFPEAKTIYMSTNYRSAQKIVDIADICIKRNKIRFEKEFISQRGLDGKEGIVTYKRTNNKNEEINNIIQIIKEKHTKEKIPYSEMAILFRNNKTASSPVNGLSMAQIPYTSTEMVKSIYDEWMFEDIKAYVNLSMGKEEKGNLLKILNHPNRYLNTAAFKNTKFDENEMLKVAQYLKNEERWKYPAAKKAIQKWIECFGKGEITDKTSTKELFNRLSKEQGINYIKHITDSAKYENEDVQDLLSSYEQLKEDALKCETVKAWFNKANRIKHIIQNNNEKKDKNGVTITTIHKSKGMEWKVVFILGVSSAVIPSKKVKTIEEHEEERRLLYVGMTRAKDELHISYYGTESIFMEETMRDLKEKYAPTIKKKLAGSKVHHIEYGEGRIVNYTKDKAIVRFNAEELVKFSFPEAFQKEQLKYL